MILKLRQEKAITLIALVITIIVLIILAGVTISTLIGENGLFLKAQQAIEDSIVADEKELISLAYIENGIDNFHNDRNKTLNIKGADIISYSDEFGWIIIFRETGHKYLLSIDGEISEFTGITNPHYDEEWEYAYEYKTNNGTDYFWSSIIEKGNPVNARITLKAYKIGDTNEYDYVIEGHGNLITSREEWKNYFPTDGLEGDEPFNLYNKNINVNYIICDGITGIQGGGFADVDCIKKFSLPKSLNYIEEGTLCRNACDIELDSQNQYYTCEDNVIFNKNKTELVFYSPIKQNTSYTLPSTVTKIDEFAFRGNEYIENVNLSSNLNIIGNYAFSLCDNLSTINLNNGLSYIGKCAFQNCKNIKEIYIPSTVSEISSYAFGAWDEDQTIYCMDFIQKPNGWNNQWDGDRSTSGWGYLFARLYGWYCDASVVWKGGENTYYTLIIVDDEVLDNGEEPEDTIKDIREDFSEGTIYNYAYIRFIETNDGNIAYFEYRDEYITEEYYEEEGLDNSYSSYEEYREEYYQDYWDWYLYDISELSDEYEETNVQNVIFQ